MERNFVRFQAEHHPLVQTDGFESMEEYCLHLMHLRAYEEVALLARGRTVIDLGCNNGWGTRIISREARRVVGVDVSQSALDEARRSPAAANIEFRKVDGDRLPFADGEFDVAVSCQVIEHIADYTPYLGEVHRVLRKDGIAIFTTPNACIRLDPGMKPWFPFHIREFNATDLASLLRKWFGRVDVKGLFATPALYEIEFRRVQRSRENARRRARAWLPPYVELKAKAIDTVKAVLPGSIVKGVQTLARNLSPERDVTKAPGSRIRPKVDPASFGQFSVADFDYRSSNLDDALDLMAVCQKVK